MNQRKPRKARRTWGALVFFVLLLAGCHQAENPWHYQARKANAAPKLNDKIDFLEERLQSRPRAFLEMAELAGLYLQRGKSRRDQSDVDKAQEWVERSLEEFENAPALLVRADALQMEHHFTEALEVLQKALALDPGNLAARLLEVRVRLARGDVAGARESFQKLPESPLSSFRFLEARLEEESGHLVEARKLYEASLRGESDISSPSESARRRAVFARMELKAGDLDKAERLLQAALAIPVDQPLAQLLLGRLHSERGEYKQAAEALRAGYERYGDPLFLVHLGLAEEKAGSKAAARSTLQTAAQLLRQDNFGHERDLALALFHLDPEGNSDEIEELMAAELKRRRDSETLEVADSVGVKVE